MGKLSRRSFLKMGAIGAGAGATLAFANTKSSKKESVIDPHEGVKRVKTICSICSAGCGIIAEVKDGVWIRQDVAQDHPISAGSHCCKGVDQIDLVKSKMRLKYPLKKEGGKWKRISYDQAIEEISSKMIAMREKYGPDSMMFMGSAKMNSQQAYYWRKFAAFYGTNNIDHVARI